LKKRIGIAALVLLAFLAIGGGWFYRRYLRLEHRDLAPNAHAVLGAGGNSLIVRGARQTLLVDPKFPPGSQWLRRWLAGHGGAPTTVVDTHYHYDHTDGNSEYPNARIVAHRAVPDLMRGNAFWGPHPPRIPTVLVDDGGGTIDLGGSQVMLVHPPPAHTHGDLWVLVRAGDQEIVATGDLVFNTYYPFFDLGAGGADVQGIIRAVRGIAAAHPRAAFVPGHGPVVTAGALNRYADYLAELDQSVEKARRDGLSEEQAVERIDLSRWNFSVLPSFNDGNLCWATAANNVRAVYRLQTGAVNTPCSLWR
jgi:cyclase